MELSHVVYRVSTDKEYAAQFMSDPETSVQKLGLNLNKDELASLLSVLGWKSDQDILTMTKKGIGAHSWR
jgi:hypothetical protein